ncbi:hypothetical protein KSF78_0002643 [Schistosoma japonicum]|nr:hypothetical protein KSF78_0002643 [Schistosoma japonicum]
MIRFDGDPVHSWSLIANFEECIGNENIKHKAKLSCLIQYCDGEAKSIIHDCTLLEPEVDQCKPLELLAERFEQKHVAVRELVDEMLVIPNIRGNYLKRLRKLSTEMEPSHLLQEWVNIACRSKSGRGPEFSNATHFVDQICLARQEWPDNIKRISLESDRVLLLDTLTTQFSVSSHLFSRSHTLSLISSQHH